MEKLKKLLALFLALMMLVLALASCGPGNGDGDGGDGDDDGDSNDDEAPKGELRLIKDGKALFKIVKTSSLQVNGQKAVNTLAERLSELGVEVEVISDEDEDLVGACEVIVGDGVKHREGCDLDVREVGDEGYIIKVVGTRVVVLPGSDETAESAVDQFMRRVLGIRSETNELAKNVSVENDYEHKVKTEYPITDIKILTNSLSEYEISYDAESTAAVTAAEVIRESVYANSGIWLKDADSERTERVITVRMVSNAGAEHFRVFVDNANLVVECDYEAGFQEGVEKFTDKYFESKSGIVRFYDTTLFEYDVKAFRYSDYGAVGDGVTDDFPAIVKTHEQANLHGHEVEGDEGMTYYIGESSIGKSAVIMTNVDWRDASFIIDDSIVKPYSGRGNPIFRIDPTAKCTPKTITGSSLSGLTLYPGDTKIDMTFEYDSSILVYNENHYIFIRRGMNSGKQPQHEMLIVDKNGNIDESTFVVWEYPVITKVVVMAVDDEPITVKNGRFTTKANQLCYDFPAGSTNSGKPWLTGDQYYYYSRNISVNRSNTTVENVDHSIVDEGSGGYPYNGFITINSCNNTLLKNCTFQGHKTYREDRDLNENGIVEANEIDSGTNMGSYDFSAGNSNNILLKGCIQSNDIGAKDTDFWGVMCSNFCRNLTYDECRLSRFDAHEGAFNITVRNSTVGKINAIGGGLLTVDTVTQVSSNFLVSLRDDYGSTWNGDAIIRNVTLTSEGVSGAVAIFNGAHYGDWDYGYTCYMPQNVVIDDVRAPNATRLNVFNIANLSAEGLMDTAVNPLQLTKTITIRNQKQNIYLTNPQEYLYSVRDQINVIGDLL